MSLSTLIVKALLIILHKHSLIESRQCRESEKCRNSMKMQPIKGKNHENESLMGPLFTPTLGGPVGNSEMASDLQYHALMKHPFL